MEEQDDDQGAATARERWSVAVGLGKIVGD
jgi:hypothetical protein